MKRIQFHRYGGPDEMRVEEYRLPKLSDDEILVRVKAASINPVDWKIRQGAMKIMTGRRFPRGMGQDFSGIVEGVGRSVKRFKIGDEVLGATPVKTSGSFAETLITKEALAFAKPAALSHEEAATLPVAASTAWVALVQKAGLKPGQSVFINGAYGAVGQAATQIAKALGASVAGRVAADCIDAAKGIGADVVLDYRQPIPPGLFGTFDVVFDTHGSLTLKDGKALAKPGGTILDINPSPSKMLRIFLSRARKFVMGKQDEATLREVVALAAKGKLKISIGRVAPLNEASDLIRKLEAGERIRGKGLIVMGPRP
ncbi:NAD(P)-dependent alcohol dehydrogenase [Bradyrhizobium cajani]|uniref:Zinc-binding dehydrogenase n=1 Tax=Bradyrhizobium cajani TaxID=1928661 RepID=A0A844TLK8_9BRAD|nr:NAD(P)-dependent alcohol dehydrogenase [Bradyrhizobium cajani]MCP3368185.1 NAD(P)-dependent alcohol dehydrogenase [Bradyrhizobium cajani]MVT76734.1 zinc-binding dehydrogenase [Bradyrhizobium cajani]